jgi:hypothetical protein
VSSGSQQGGRCWVIPASCWWSVVPIGKEASSTRTTL